MASERWQQAVSREVVNGKLRVWHLDGVEWLHAPLPWRWHKCKPQTRGVIGFETVYRCACGAISNNGLDWIEKNSRRAKQETNHG